MADKKSTGAKRGPKPKAERPPNKVLIWNHDCDNVEGGELFSNMEAALIYIQEESLDIDMLTIVEVVQTYEV